MELKEIIGKESFEFTDIKGVKHNITPLNLCDISDLQDKYGFMENINEKLYLSVKFHLFTLWLSLRKEGLTQQEIDKSNWKIGLDSVAKILPNKIDNLVDLTTKLFVISGIVKLEESPKNVSTGVAENQEPPK